MRKRYNATDTDFDHYTSLLRARLEVTGWERTLEADWQLLFSSGVQPGHVYAGLQPLQRINHFPGVAPIIYKDELAYFLTGAGHTGVLPATYSMPGGWDALAAHAAGEPDALWIAKPKRLGASEGIELLSDISQAPRRRDMIVQQYVADPLLFPEYSHKHGLRVYVLVTSLDPLVAYVYPNGLVKFAQEAYRRERSDLANRRIHLTNTHLPEGVERAAVPTVDFVSYREVLRSLGVDDHVLWAGIRRLLVTALTALAPPMLALTLEMTGSPGSCFELLVADVLVDASHRPWLLEFNESPSLGVQADRPGESDVRRSVKEPLVADMLRLIGAEDEIFAAGDDPARLADEAGRRGSWEPL